MSELMYGEYIPSEIEVELIAPDISGEHIPPELSLLVTANEFAVTVDSGLPGANAPEVTFAYSIDGSTLWHSTYTEGDMYARISTDGESTWGSAFRFIGVLGGDGQDGADGNTLLGGAADPTTEGVSGDWYIQRTSWHIWENVAGVWTDRGSVKGVDGENGAGVPSGGTADQILEKVDGTDYNTQWRDAPVEATATNVASIIHAQSDKTTPADADELPLTDSAMSYVLKGLSWGNLKATLKTYFDSLYGSGSMSDLVDDTSPTLGGDLDADNKSIINAELIEFYQVYNNTGTAINWTLGNKQKKSVGGNVTLTFTAPSGPTNLLLELTFSGAYTVALPATVKWVTAEPAYESSKTYIICFWYNGSNYYASCGLGVS